MKTQTLVEVEFEDLGQKLTRMHLLKLKEGFRVVASSVITGCKFLNALVIAPVTLKPGAQITLQPEGSNTPIQLRWRIKTMSEAEG